MSFGGFDQNGGTNRPMNEINMVPLIDVMLVLLIVFIITAPLMTNAIKIDLPNADAPANDAPPDAITLAIQPDGSLWWNNDPISKTDLDTRLQAAAAQPKQPELHLRADRETRYDAIADTLARAQNAGLQKIGFVTLPENTP